MEASNTLAQSWTLFTKMSSFLFLGLCVKSMTVNSRCPCRRAGESSEWRRKQIVKFSLLAKQFEQKYLAGYTLIFAVDSVTFVVMEVMSCTVARVTIKSRSNFIVVLTFTPHRSGGFH